MDKRYQIFISSTYSDLIEEREKVIHAVLEQNCFPTGMEIFPAAGVPPKDVIKSFLKGCDYYILIIAARYGSLTDAGISYTEWEYDIAVESGIPVLAFLHNDVKSIPLGKADDTDVLREKLLLFRKKVERGGQTVKYWNSALDLKAKVTSSISFAIKFQPRPGWIKADTSIENDKDRLMKYREELNKLWALSMNQEKIGDASKKEANEIIRELQSELNWLKGIFNSTLDLRSESLLVDAEFEELKVENVSFKMIYVKGGHFRMGATPEQGRDAENDEKPVHDVFLSNYWIAETQVTQALWLAVMEEDNPSHFTAANGFKEDLNRPVESVSWYDCQRFIRKLNRRMHKEFRLPTEAEWEYAARGGHKCKKDHQYKYAGSDDINEVAWINKRCTSAVATMKANDLGLFDMSGNVWEWCNDRFASTYDTSDRFNPLGPENGDDCVIRGGAYDSRKGYCRVSNRYCFPPDMKYEYVGLRLVLPIEHNDKIDQKL